MSPTVVVLLEYLSSRCNLWHLHSADEDLIKMALYTLLKRGQELDVIKITGWLRRNDWPSGSIVKFKLILEVLLSGKKVRMNDIVNAPSEKSLNDLLDRLLNDNSIAS